MSVRGIVDLLKGNCLYFGLSLILITCCDFNAQAQACTNAPTVGFDKLYDDNSCLLNTTIKFVDRSVSNGSSITKWEWNFGDGTTSTERSPTYTYKTYNTFNVTLTLYYGSGCSLTSAVQTVDTRPNLRPDFEFDVQKCPNVPVKFIDRSFSKPAVGTWVINFGDGSNSESYNSNGPWFHTFKKSGKYMVSLFLVSATSPICVSDLVKKEVEVTAVDFNICQGEVTQFTDETVKPGTPGFTYSWDFGDAVASTLVNPNTSTDQNPTHRYTSPGDYTAKLTVSSPNGCVNAFTTKTITVTGLPIANFDIDNKATLCGADSVTFIDKTSTGSNINKLVWFYDVVNHPNDSLVINKAQMRGDKKYQHFYGINNGNAAITYRTMLIARIGGPCPDPKFTQDVVINPTPVISLRINGSAFSDPYVLCEGTSPVTLTTSSGVPGKAIFTGTGVINGNMFDPGITGRGTFTVTCVFTGDNTPCPYTTSFTIVVGSPIVTLLATAGIFEGTPIQLNPVVTGSNLKYSWSPVAGISNATILNPLFNPASDTKYTLTVTSDVGCTTSADVVIKVMKTPVIPNAFTPNNDGVNDTWEIKYLDTYPNATIEVFNRSGARVFTSNSYSKPWDGTVNGHPLPLGVYYYVINPKSGRPIMGGSLTIIK